jgi:phosphopantetheine adenylyltransferase
MHIISKSTTLNTIDAVIIAVMTRKQKENLCDYDETYDINFLTENFMAYNCPERVGKPIILLIDGIVTTT